MLKNTSEINHKNITKKKKSLLSNKTIISLKSYSKNIANFIENISNLGKSFITNSVNYSVYINDNIEEENLFDINNLSFKIIEESND